MSEKGRHKNQKVFQPLMHTQHFQVGLPGDRIALEQATAITLLEPGRRRIRRHDNCLPGSVENGNIVAVIARIIETARTIMFAERVRLAMRREIGRASADMDGAENAKLRCNRLRIGFSGGRGQNQLSPACMFGPQIIEKILPVGQHAGIDCDAARNLMLQMRFARQEPHRQKKCEEYILFQKNEYAFPQQIRRNECSVQINRQRHIPAAFAPRIHTQQSPWSMSPESGNRRSGKSVHGTDFWSR